MGLALGLVSGLGLTAALVLTAAVGYAVKFDRSAPVLWASYGLWGILVAVCFVLGARLRTSSVFAFALLAGACVGAALWLMITWLLDNALGFGA